ncbi:hypothetical protein D3C81_643430 [compost metagenome]
MSIQGVVSSYFWPTLLMSGKDGSIELVEPSTFNSAPKDLPGRTMSSASSVLTTTPPPTEVVVLRSKDGPLMTSMPAMRLGSI